MLWYQLQQPRPMTLWAEGLVRMLSLVYGGRQYSAQSESDVGICRCVESLQAVCEELRRLPAAAVPECSAAMALDFFLAQVAAETLRPGQKTALICPAGWTWRWMTHRFWWWPASTKATFHR
jgi:hypothetical protein